MLFLVLTDLEQIDIDNDSNNIPAMVIHGYDVHEEDINTLNPEGLINDTILSVMLR